MKNNAAKPISLLASWTRDKNRFNATLEGCIDGFQCRPFSPDYDKGFGEVSSGRIFNAQISYETGRIIGRKLSEIFDSFPSEALTPKGLMAVACMTNLVAADINPKCVR